MAADGDLALQVLLRPLASGLVPWPGRGLFLNARGGWPLQQLSLPGLACAQSHRPEHDALVREGRALEPDGDTTRYPLVMVLPPRQRDAARAMLAQALDRLAPGGRVLAAMPNQEGAKSGEADLARLAGPVSVQTKHHCRVFWTGAISGPADPQLHAAWRALAQPRRIADAGVPGGGFTTRPGIFAWDRVDAASALLAARLPADLAGRAGDFGAGWGYLALALLERAPAITSLDLYEADAQALACARTNLAPLADRAQLGFHWHDVAAGVQGPYDVVISNPPFHGQGRADRPELGRAFLRAAAGALRKGGRLFVVANRHLPYEADLSAHFDGVRVLADAQGFKVLEARAR